MKRGDVLVVALKGDYGKPRPAVALQSDFFDEHPSVTIAPITTTVVDAPLFRITMDPDATNGLRSISQIMVDKVTTVRKDRVAETIGHLSDDVLLRVNRALMLWLGLTA